MRNDDRDIPQSEVPDEPSELELRLAEYDWTTQAGGGVEQLRQALAVLAVLEMEDAEDEFELCGSLWLH